MADAEGNAIAVGYKGYLVFEVTNILTNGALVWQGGLDGTQTIITPGTNSHKGQSNWPGVPS